MLKISRAGAGGDQKDNHRFFWGVRVLTQAVWKQVRLKGRVIAAYGRAVCNLLGVVLRGSERDPCLVGMSTQPLQAAWICVELWGLLEILWWCFPLNPPEAGNYQNK